MYLEGYKWDDGDIGEFIWGCENCLVTDVVGTILEHFTKDGNEDTGPGWYKKNRDDERWFLWEVLMDKKTKEGTKQAKIEKIKKALDKTTDAEDQTEA
ncbi:MAG: hypothetical protein R2849_13680 [Thermomicrobiales bacterium]